MASIGDDGGGAEAKGGGERIERLGLLMAKKVLQVVDLLMVEKMGSAGGINGGGRLPGSFN